MALAACSGPKKPIAAPAPPPPAPVAPAPAPPPEAPQNKVALLVPLTGANAALGQSIANAANMALLDAGDKRINLRLYDTAAGAGAAARAALADGAGVVLGPLRSAEVAPVKAALAGKPVPIISFSNDAAVAGGPVWVLGVQPAQSITRAVQWARSRGVERFAALVPMGVYGQRAQAAFQRAVVAAGGQASGIVSYGRDPASQGKAVAQVTAQASRVAAAASASIRPDGSVARPAGTLPPLPFQALLVADNAEATLRLLGPLARLGAAPGSFQLIGTELWNADAGLDKVPALRGAVYATVSDARFARLAERYRARFGGNPSRLASMGYDAVLLVNSLAGRWPLGAPFPGAALASRDGFAGVDGAFRFGANHVAERLLAVEQVGPNGIVTVAAAPTGF
ncbi:MAG: penicillin-binding protein activator [Sphingomonadales bacterium]